MSYGILFGGQGNQHAGMLPWLPADAGASPALAEADSLLRSPWRAVLADENLRHANRVAQPLITATSLAAWEHLQPQLPAPPTAVAGYSVGELAAYACAGVLSSVQAVRLAAQRAYCMDAAAQGSPAGLMSVSGMPVERVLRQHIGLHAAIVIDKDHAIVGGLQWQLDEAQAQLVHAGATCKRLGIGVASHTPWMQAASACFAQALESIALQPASVPVVVNAGARTCRRSDALQAALCDQISQTVDWASCMDALAETGVRCVLEIGPGSALAAIWNRRYPDLPARALEEFLDPRGAAQWLRRHCAADG